MFRDEHTRRRGYTAEGHLAVFGWHDTRASDSNLPLAKEVIAPIRSRAERLMLRIPRFAGDCEDRAPRN